MKLKKTFNKLLIAACAFGTISTAPLMTLQAQAAEVASEPVVHGLKGEYYTSLGSPQFNFGTLKSTVLDPNLDFGNLDPAFGILTGQQDNVNVRWSGFIEPQFSEDYTFSIIGDNGFRLWIDNKLVIDHWVNDWDKEQVAAPIRLVAGQNMRLRLNILKIPADLIFTCGGRVLPYRNQPYQLRLLPRQADSPTGQRSC